MAKELYEIKGFKELQQKLKKLGSDKDKRRTILAILRKSARSTIAAAKALSPPKAPKKSRSYKHGNRPYHVGGTGEKSIKFQVLRRAKNPMGIIGPRSLGKYDGWYIRKFVIPGKSGGKSEPNYFMDKAKALTQGRVSSEAIPAMEKFIQRKIDQL